MTEHAAFTPREAAQALAEASTWEESLRNRTEGLTWMVWGLASPAIWLSYGFVGATLEGPWPWWAEWLWAPWVAAGVLTSVALWRSAALAAPRLAKEEPKGWVVGAAWVAVVAVMWGAIAWLGPQLNEALVPLLVIGSAWTLFGAVNLYKCSRVGRAVSIAIGVAVLAAGVALAFVAGGPSHRDYTVTTVGAVLASGIFPLLGGLWQTLRA